jgi:hypothetical protein
MKERPDVQLAWEVWHMIVRLDDLLWRYYKDEFLRQDDQDRKPDSTNQGKDIRF